MTFITKLQCLHGDFNLVYSNLTLFLEFLSSHYLLLLIKCISICVFHMLFMPTCLLLPSSQTQFLFCTILIHKSIKTATVKLMVNMYVTWFIQEPASGTFLSHIIQVFFLIPLYSNHFYHIFPSVSRFPKWSLPFRLANCTVIYVLLSLH